MTPSSAVEFLSQPLIVLVENSTSDGEFLRALAKQLGTSRLAGLLKDGRAIAFDGPGGKGEIPKRVRHHVDRARKRGVCARLFVLIDSDALAPWNPSDPSTHEILGEKTREIKKLCSSEKVACHVLRKREIENYLPIQALRAWFRKDGQKLKVVDAYAALTPSQQDHFDMKRGFPNPDGIATPQIPPAQAELFKSLAAPASRDTFLTLKSGFGSDVYRAFERTDQYTNSDLRTRSDPGARASDTEVDRIVATLCELL